MWAAGMAGIRLPSMMPGLRMEEGTVASGGLETSTILEGLPGWSRAGAKARAAKDGKKPFPPLHTKQRAGQGAGAPKRRLPLHECKGEDGKKLQVSFQEATTKHKKKKNKKTIS